MVHPRLALRPIWFWSIDWHSAPPLLKVNCGVSFFEQNKTNICFCKNKTNEGIPSASFASYDQLRPGRLQVLTKLSKTKPNYAREKWLFAQKAIFFLHLNPLSCPKNVNILLSNKISQPFDSINVCQMHSASLNVLDLYKKQFCSSSVSALISPNQTQMFSTATFYSENIFCISRSEGQLKSRLRAVYW